MTATSSAKQPSFTIADWGVTEEKVMQAVERIIAVANPLKIIAFGSRARGDFRPESDLDLAVMFDHLDPKQPRPVSSANLRGIVMPVDMLVFDKQRHDEFRPCVASVHYDIDIEGVVLYERGHDQSANRSAVALLVQR
ncbi:MAG: nucleotidyltransferase domain-containing protein [Acidobacteriaceae bacterium]